MFENKRFITCGVESELPRWLQNLLWYAINVMEVESMDYLQVFILTAGTDRQKIVHTQEDPPYEQKYSFRTRDSVSAKVFIIDDGTQTTMLLAEEY